MLYTLRNRAAETRQEAGAHAPSAGSKAKVEAGRLDLTNSIGLRRADKASSRHGFDLMGGQHALTSGGK
jgi:hypothetical protein